MITVLVVDDDFRVAQLHASYAGQVDGFSVAGVAHTAADAVSMAAALAPDLVLLDEYLPDASGTSIICRLGAPVMMVSAAEDSAVIRGALGAGAVNYILKPFPPKVLAERLHAFARFRRMLGDGAHLDQPGIDRALQALRAGDSPVVATRKGRSPVTLQAISDALMSSEDALTAIEVADLTGVSRATAQRYLSDLAREGLAQLTLRYGSTGRPEHCFEWLGRRG